MEEQPGQTVAPNGAASDQAGLQQPPAGASTSLPRPALETAAPQYAAATVPNGAASPDLAPQSVPGAHENGSWQYAADAHAWSPASSALPDDISWTAAEFVEHQKSTSWYMALTVAALAAAAIDFLFTRDFISTGVIILAAALFGTYAGHKPRTQQYYLSPQGLQIGEKLYGFQAFRNFSVIEEGNLISIVFMPLKRFAPSLTIYVAQDIEERVLDYLSEFLPFEQHQGDAVDGLLRRIRF
jgi:hypothetical protein